MTRTEVAAELAGVVRLLREHAFLRYSEAGRSEYEQKLRTASGLFARAVARASGISVLNPYPMASVEGVQAGGPDSGARAARRIAARLSAAASGASGSDAARLTAAAESWRAAAAAIAALPR